MVRALSLIGCFLIALEGFLLNAGKSLCTSRGCKVVLESAGVHEYYILLAGFLAFCTIFVSTFVKEKTGSRIITLALTGILSAEGVFVGYQLFYLKEICQFCMIIFAIFLLISVVRYKEAVYGFLGFLFAVSSMFLVAPEHFKLEEGLTLIFKNDCPHCEKVIEFAEKNDVELKKVNVNKVLNLVKDLGISEVPILISKQKGRIEILVGEDEIVDFLSGSPVIELPEFEENGTCGIEKECE